MADAQLSSLILIGICILLSAFFSSSEAAYLALERVRLAHLVNTNRPGARRVAAMIEHPERLLSTILFGNNLVNVAFTALITVVALNIFGDQHEGLAAIVATVVGTALLLIFGETIPKTIAVHQSERLSFWYSRPLLFLERLFWPVVIVLQGLTRLITRYIGVSPGGTRLHYRRGVANANRHRGGRGHIRPKRGRTAARRLSLWRQAGARGDDAHVRRWLAFSAMPH